MSIDFRIERYTTSLPSGNSLDPSLVLREWREMTSIVENAMSKNPIPPIESLYSYNVPTPAGSCGVTPNAPLEEYDLRKIFNLNGSTNLASHPYTRTLLGLNALIDKVNADTRVDWLGFYLKRFLNGTDPTLVKIVYRGKESRAEFPLTPDFAKRSNNATVGMRGTLIVINDISKYLAEEKGPYYQCDGRVQSEACLPIFSPVSGNIIGIIDAEAFSKNKFGQRELSLLVAACLTLEDHFHFE